MVSVSEPWQDALRSAITCTEDLLRLLGLTWPVDNQTLDARFRSFPLRVPRAFVSRMEPGNRHDPLLLQVLPQTREDDYFPGFCQDPLQEKAVNPVPGILHKYHGRVLVMLSGSCAVHCRYCFRRHFDYQDNISGQQNWDKILDYISKDASINEVILSGGDPLLMKDKVLQQFVDQLDGIQHLKRLRVHTRLPIVIPERVTSDLLQCLSHTRLAAIIVMHCNHPHEIDGSVRLATQKLREHNIDILNQTVLLRSVNDSADVLIQLSEQLWEAGIWPYYLHMLDRVQGAAHFEVSEDEAKALLIRMMHRLPGYLVPKLVKEVPGALSKVAMVASDVTRG